MNSADKVDEAAPASLPNTAMVLAAGLGERMRPLTDDRPKPLIEIAGRSMIDRILDDLAAAGVGRAVVNLHYLGDTLESHLRARTGGPEIVYSDERDRRLETGGGVKRALPLFDCDPILAVNSDAVWTDAQKPAFHRLAEAWDADLMDALLLVVPCQQAVGYSGGGDFDINEAGQLIIPEDSGPLPFVFAGIQIISPKVVAAFPDEAFSLNKVYRQAADRGRLFGLVHEGGWAHVGTPEAIGPAAALVRAHKGATG